MLLYDDVFNALYSMHRRLYYCTVFSIAIFHPHTKVSHNVMGKNGNL